jgi:EAL domain-containing protein (putative c-di-GMP-specific phosphodiesterase class I)
MIDLKTGRVVCAEALLRWFSGGEVLSPIDFIPTLEETGLIVSVGDWVLEQACTHAKSWQSRGIANMRVAVNLSVRQLRQKDMIERVEMILKRTGLPPGNLELEVTESTLIDGDVIGENLKGIEALGVRLAIDDFGTGYSSLSYLKEYAVDGLKIDRSFIRDINADINDDEVTSAVVGLSKALGMNVVAEGVETIEQYGFLERLNCQTIQGFLISLPLAAAEFEDWIGKLRKDADHSVYWRPPFVL